MPYPFRNSRPLGRRNMLGLLGQFGLGLATLPLLHTRSDAAGELNYFTYAGYNVPELHPSFQAKYGKDSFTSSLFADLDEALQKLSAGFSPDVSHNCGSSIQRWREAGVTYPIDVSRLKNWPDVLAPLQQMSLAKHDGQQWFVPFDWGNNSVLYRTDLVKVEDESWGILFDEQYKGKISTYDAVDSAIVAAVASGAKDPFDPTEDEFARARQFLERQRKLVRFYWSDQTAMEQAMASGEIVAAFAWNVSAKALRKQGLPVKYMRPKEGILTWVCGLVVTNNSPEMEAKRYEFIDSMLDPSAGKYLIEEYGTGHANGKSFEIADAKLVAELGMTDPVAFLKDGIIYRAMPKGLRERYLQAFEEIKAK